MIPIRSDRGTDRNPTTGHPLLHPINDYNVHGKISGQTMRFVWESARRGRTAQHPSPGYRGHQPVFGHAEAESLSRLLDSKLDPSGLSLCFRSSRNGPPPDATLTEAMQCIGSADFLAQHIRLLVIGAQSRPASTSSTCSQSTGPFKSERPFVWCRFAHLPRGLPRLLSGAGAGKRPPGRRSFVKPTPVFRGIPVACLRDGTRLNLPMKHHWILKKPHIELQRKLDELKRAS